MRPGLPLHRRSSRLLVVLCLPGKSVLFSGSPVSTSRASPRATASTTPPRTVRSTNGGESTVAAAAATSTTTAARTAGCLPRSSPHAILLQLPGGCPLPIRASDRSIWATEATRGPPAPTPGPSAFGQPFGAAAPRPPPAACPPLAVLLLHPDIRRRVGRLQRWLPQSFRRGHPGPDRHVWQPVPAQHEWTATAWAPPAPGAAPPNAAALQPSHGPRRQPDSQRRPTKTSCTPGKRQYPRFVTTGLLGAFQALGLLPDPSKTVVAASLLKSLYPCLTWLHLLRFSHACLAPAPPR